MLGKLNATDRSSRALIGLGLAVILFFAVNIFSNTAFSFLGTSESPLLLPPPISRLEGSIAEILPVLSPSSERRGV